jgi:hypothetical protein
MTSARRDYVTEKSMEGPPNPCPREAWLKCSSTADVICSEMCVRGCNGRLP